MELNEIAQLPSIYFKIVSSPFPDILFDDYQELQMKDGVEVVNKVQPKGWTKRGLWIGDKPEPKHRNLNRRKFIHKKSHIKLMKCKGSISVYTKEVDNRYASLKDIRDYYDSIPR